MGPAQGEGCGTNEPNAHPFKHSPEVKRGAASSEARHADFEIWELEFQTCDLGHDQKINAHHVWCALESVVCMAWCVQTGDTGTEMNTAAPGEGTRCNGGFCLFGCQMKSKWNLIASECTSHPMTTAFMQVKPFQATCSPIPFQGHTAGCLHPCHLHTVLPLRGLSAAPTTCTLAIDRRWSSESPSRITLAFQWYFKYHLAEPRHTLSELSSNAPFGANTDCVSGQDNLHIGGGGGGGGGGKGEVSVNLEHRAHLPCCSGPHCPPAGPPAPARSSMRCPAAAPPCAWHCRCLSWGSG